MFYKDCITFWQHIKLKSAPPQRNAHTHNPHSHTLPSQKEFALFDNQIDIVNTIICRQNKRKQNNQSKAMRLVKVMGDPSPLIVREEAMGGEKDLKRVSYKVLEFFTLSLQKTRTK